MDKDTTSIEIMQQKPNKAGRNGIHAHTRNKLDIYSNFLAFIHIAPPTHYL